MPPEMHEHRFKISSTFADVADLAESAATICARTSGDSVLADSLRLCLAEALNNVVEHAYQGEGGHEIDIKIGLRQGAFEVSIVDQGRPMPDGAIPAGIIDFDDIEFDELPEGGFGWMLIRNEVDFLSYERKDDRNVLSLGKVNNA